MCTVDVNARSSEARNENMAGSENTFTDRLGTEAFVDLQLELNLYLDPASHNLTQRARLPKSLKAQP
jgi:hypothetical protein